LKNITSNKKILLLILLGFFIVILTPFMLGYYLERISVMEYNHALGFVDLYNYTSDSFDYHYTMESYKAAYEKFGQLRKYAESEKYTAIVKDRILELEQLERDYQDAELLFVRKEYEAAATAFSKLREYRDGANRELNALYLYAEGLLSDGEYIAAAEEFSKLHGYGDSNEKEKYAFYSYAKKLLDDEKFAEAEIAFSDARLSGYLDSDELRYSALNSIHKNKYVYAVELFDNEQYQDAANIFMSLGDYEDSYIRYVESIRRLAVFLTMDSNAHAIAAGHNHSIGLTSDGMVVTTGDSAFGRRDTESWSNVVSVTAGRALSAALTKDGRVLVATDDVSIKTAEQWTSVVAISAGNDFLVGLTEDKKVLFAGDGRTWLGHNPYPNNTLKNAEEWDDIVSIAAGWRHIVGLTSKGEVRIIGKGAVEQLDELRRIMDSDDWTNDIVSIAAGGGYQDVDGEGVSDEYYITALLKRDGTVVILGNLKDSDKATVMGGDNAWANIKALAVGSWHIVGLTNDGRVLTTGSGYYADLDRTDDTSNIMNVDGWAQSGNPVVEIAAGTGFTLALNSDGSMVSVGFNRDYQRYVSGWSDIAVNNERLSRNTE